MRVIEDKFNPVEKEVYEETCSNCGSIFEYDKDDVKGYGAFGVAYLYCPVCGEETDLDECGLTLTKDNIKFPDHFYSFYSDDGVKDEEIEDNIRRGIEYLREHKDQEDWYTGFSNLFIEIEKNTEDEEYDILVAKNYYDGFIPFEKEDY